MPGVKKGVTMIARGCRTIPSRRRLMLLCAAMALALPAGLPGVDHGTEVLLLNCMDYRLVDHTAHYMASRGLTGKYDDIVLAGAALGAVTDKHPAWNETFWDELGVALELHHIHKVMVLDHRDCGAYKVIFGEDFAKDAAKEKTVHAAQLRKLGDAIRGKYPALEVELLLMALDGKVETIAGSVPK